MYSATMIACFVLTMTQPSACECMKSQWQLKASDCSVYTHLLLAIYAHSLNSKREELLATETDAICLERVRVAEPGNDRLLLFGRQLQRRSETAHTRANHGTHRVSCTRSPDTTLLADDSGFGDFPSSEQLGIDVRCASLVSLCGRRVTLRRYSHCQDIVKEVVRKSCARWWNVEKGSGGRRRYIYPHCGFGDRHR